MSGICWNPLQIGDTVEVIAPAWRCSPEELNTAIKKLESWGLVPRVPSDLFGKPSHPFAQTDEIRLQHLKQALYSSESKVIWCVRGGYGSLRLLPQLNRMKRPSRCKLLIGLSDITSLHLLLNQKWKWPTLHGPLLDRFGRQNNTDSALKKILFGRTQEVHFSSLQPMNQAARKAQTLKGPIVGGNLTTLVSSLATPWQIRTRGQILFFEEVGERGYRVDRMLTQLEQAQLLAGVKAIIFGQFRGGEEKNGRELWRQVKRDFAEKMPFPVLRGLPSGHGVIQKPLPLGVSATLSLGHQRACLSCPCQSK